MRFLFTSIVLWASLAILASCCTTGFVNHGVIFCNFMMLGDPDYDNNTILADCSSGFVVDTSSFVPVLNGLDAAPGQNNTNSCSINDKCINCLRDEIFVRTWLDSGLEPHSSTSSSTQACLEDSIAVCASSLGVCVHGEELKRDLCLMLNCAECKGVINWAQCKSVRFGFWKTILIVAGVIAGLCILPWISPIFYGCFRCCKAVVACGMNCACCRGRASQVIMTEELNIIEDVDSEDEGLAKFENLPEGGIAKDVKPDGSVYYVSRSGGSLRVNSVITIVALSCLLCLASAQSCTGVISSVSVVPTCMVFNTTHKTCTAKPTVLLSLPGVGTKACMSLTANSETIGNITVTFTSATAITTLNNQYYTSSWTPGYVAVRRCRGASGANCNRYSDPRGCSNCMQLNPCSQLPSSYNYLYNYPGESGCIDGPTCSCAAGSGNACQNYRFSLIPDGPAYRVMRPSFTEREAVISVQECIQGVCSKYYVSTRAPQVISGNLTLTFSGLYTTITPNFDSFSVVERITDGVAKLVPAAAPQAYSADIFGDIQSGTLAQLKANSFNWARNVVSFYAQCDGMTWGWRPASASKFSTYTSFPTTWGGLLFGYSSGTLRAPTGGLTGTQLTLSHNQNITFSLLLDVIVPDIISSTEVSGCYSCSEMAAFNVTAKSLTREGTCTFSSATGTITSPQALLKTSQEVYPILVLYTSKVTQDTLTLSCNGGTDSLNLTVVVVEKSILTPDGETFIHREQPAGGTGLSLAGKLGLGLGLGLPLASLGILALVVLFGGCLGLTVIDRFKSLCCCGKGSEYKSI